MISISSKNWHDQSGNNHHHRKNATSESSLELWTGVQLKYFASRKRDVRSSLPFFFIGRGTAKRKRRCWRDTAAFLAGLVESAFQTGGGQILTTNSRSTRFKC
ncbi:jg27304 [Pararge aegeria aegeria]|uniref:Jg27303 protein n=1 Tax=Pararge aegeria aegeria TaxID=348720 RepID=A0A8S4SPK3_9NEOP|nr:jg27303 [Pararge aegeria aegeria]CAH2269495.1 jg27304 [Pararge aegeria aegeria]